MTYHPSSRAFTLVETLVAISILTVAIIGPFVAIQNALNASYAARDQLTASMLAQEAIEYARGVRDSNFIYKVANPSTTRTWLYGLDGTDGSDNCISPNVCVVDPTRGEPTVSGAVTPCSGTCPALRLSPTTHLFTQETTTGFTTTVFTRSVTLSSVSANEMSVIVTVSFTSAHKSYSVTLTETLANWL